MEAKSQWDCLEVGAGWAEDVWGWAEDVWGWAEDESGWRPEWWVEEESGCVPELHVAKNYTLYVLLYVVEL
jgi:hypothetical protein